MSSLYEVFAQLPEPRSPLGRRHPLPAILSQATVAMLGGARSLVTADRRFHVAGSASSFMVATGLLVVAAGAKQVSW